MSEKFIDVSFMKRTEIVQAIRNSESLDKALILMNGFAANGWLHLWDNAKHPDGSSVQSQWQSSQQAEIERLEKEVHHWKSNHAYEVERGRLLKCRPDLPLERAQAYNRVVLDNFELLKGQRDRLVAEVKVYAGSTAYLADDMRKLIAEIEAEIA